MEKFSMYVGIDVSKDWLDVAIVSQQNETMGVYKIDNTVASIKKFVKGLPVEEQPILFCLENTGRYGNAFLEVTVSLQLKTWVEHPLQIKRSQGIARGKTDKYDAIRIAEYAHRFSDKAVLWQPEEKAISELRTLQAKRDILVKTYRQVKQVSEGKLDPDLQSTMTALLEAIDRIEEKMEAIIHTDEKLLKQYELLRSVPGIGKVIAVSLLVTTKGFTKLTDPRKLACYIGIAPFPYQSGSSINYKDRVSMLGDQRLKALINLSAWNAIRAVPSLKIYFDRKVAQGKHKLSAINAIRNKMIAMALSVIRRNQPYSKYYLGAAA
jgi:transposase